MEIRPFHIDDHSAAVALWSNTEGVGLSDADSAENIAVFLARNPDLSWVAFSEGCLVGTILCGHDGRRGLIHHLAVHPDSRHQKVATILVRHGLRGLRSAGIQKCHLMVFRDNTRAQAFWLAVGAEERVSLGLFSMATDFDGGV